MNLRRLLPPTVLVAGLALFLFFVFRLSSVQPPPAPPAGEVAVTHTDHEEALQRIVDSELTPLPRQSVMIYYPAYTKSESW